MANFIEEFYYGNIDPQTIGRNECQIQKVMKLLATNEERLTEHLQGQDKTIFLEYVDAWGVVMGACTADNFINGFRLGAKVYLRHICGCGPSGDWFQERSVST